MISLCKEGYNNMPLIILYNFCIYEKVKKLKRKKWNQKAAILGILLIFKIESQLIEILLIFTG